MNAIDHNKIDKDLLVLEEKLSENDDINKQPPDDIISFNELRSCADLLRMYTDNQLKIDPDFQRNLVWTAVEKTRFIDSLTKQLPIPSMCISLDYKTDKRLVIDGLQRITTIVSFLNQDSWQLSKIDDVDERLSGKTPEQIKIDNPEIFSKIQNLTIPITVLRCDYSKKSHMEYLFTIFHRLNSGGSRLNNQEIRNCIYSGNFNNLLKEIADAPISKNIFNYSKPNLVSKKTKKNVKPYRYQYEELYLRIISFSVKLNDYDGKLSKFLNDFMGDNRDASLGETQKWKNNLLKTLEIAQKDNRLSRLSKSVNEAILFGIYMNLDNSELESEEILIAKITSLLEQPEFSLISLKEGLASKDKVIGRLSKAIQIFE
ncbi:hypothetical protein B9T26_01450 [Acinetobacter sp. ANC 4169]|uniref:DUF262 domain-containing protein n=1 Tax=Acinetobacter sp. ANC 4169 TaxID=1977879 RepID=UPI000A34676C|nr:DUF262 domain-containing protein [Acinetobacter sp. ANC 4169]OTG76504.1 hypothetical protein B9T26_01450 [Acinetobacter sp. ANC 4169]